jgi:hypothetical protein
MGTRYLDFFKTSPDNPNARHCEELIIIMKTWSRSNGNSAGKLNSAHKVGEGLIEEEIAFCSLSIFPLSL